MSNFGITPEHYQWIKKILSAYLPKAKIYVFGSRSRGDQKRYSDLDLAIETKSPVSTKTLLEIQEQFSESTVPFIVDLVELSRIEPDFILGIQEDLQEF